MQDVRAGTRFKSRGGAKRIITKYQNKLINMDVKSLSTVSKIYTILSKYSWPRFSGFCDPRKPGSSEGVQGEKI